MNDDVFIQAQNWLDQNLPVAMATIVRIFGSSSQPLGARMVMTTQNRFVGMVSGGCVETDVYETGSIVMKTRHPLMLHYKKVENPIIEIGLNCEGKIDVLVEPLDQDLLTQLTAPKRRVNITLCSPSQPENPDIVHAQVYHEGTRVGAVPIDVEQQAQQALRQDLATFVTYPTGRIALFEPVQPPPLLLIIGADQVAVPLARFARILGFRVVVTDARPAFASAEKHPDADQVIAAWPQEVIQQVGVDDRTYVVSLNHEPRFEDALVYALANQPLAYFGAIGKPMRKIERHERLTQAGFDLSQLPEIYTPIGLDLGGKTPEEIALSIIAQIVAVRNGRSGGTLS
jgi:xanthine dehydrogenase accessory factor